MSSFYFLGENGTKKQNNKNQNPNLSKVNNHVTQLSFARNIFNLEKKKNGSENSLAQSK